MKKGLLLIIVVLLGAMRSFAAGPSYNTWWQNGDRFYQQKQYDSAAYYFELIAKEKPQNAVVYYNLGNAYYRLNNIGLAVLNYRRALRIDPAYKEANDNLSLAQSRISNRIPYTKEIFFLSWWHSLTSPQYANTSAVIALIIFLAIIALLIVRRVNRTFNIPPQLIGILSVMWIVVLWIAVISGNNKVNSKDAVVMQNDTPVMNDQHEGKPICLIPEGTTVELKEAKGEWVEVRLPDGRSGWVQQTSVTKI